MPSPIRYPYIVFLLMMICGIAFAASSEQVVYVAPGGNDDMNTGTKQKPFRTLMRARDALRTMPPGQSGRIILRGGEYYEVRLVLEPADSGISIGAAPGEKPILYGGRPVRNWRPEENFLSASLKGVREGTWDFRALVVNGRLPQRARLPETGAFNHLSRFDVRWMSTTGGGWERKPTEAELVTMRYRAGDLGTWLDLRNAELTVFHAWDESLVGLKSLDALTRIVIFSVPSGHPPGAFGD